MRDADAKSRDYRTDGTPTGASRLRVPKMRVYHERVGKRGGPFDGRASEGSRGLTILQDVNELVLPPSPHRGRRERGEGAPLQ
jgi:hypothetical protein